MKKNWADKGRRVYIHFTIKKAGEHLKCGMEKIVRFFGEFDSV